MKRLPKRWPALPGAPRLKIELKTRHEINVASGKDTVGFYDHENLAIWIDKNLPISEKWRVLWHEIIGHATIEWYDELVVHKTVKPWED